MRQRQKENERQEFDKIMSNFRDNRGGSRITTLNEDTLNVLSSKIVFFYDPDKDINRLVI